MRRTGFLMLAAAALCAVAGFSASGAYAELPEIGRCVKLEGVPEGHKMKYSGKYSNRKCTRTSASSTGKFEWMPGAGEEKTFESPGTLEPATLKTAAGTAIECKNTKQFGEYTSATTEKDEISLYECVLSSTGETCQSARPEETPPNPEAGTIISLPLEGKLGYIKKSNSKPQIGWEYKPKTGRLPVRLRMRRPGIASVAGCAAARGDAGSADAGSAGRAGCAECERADPRDDRRCVHLADPQAGRQDGRRIPVALGGGEREELPGNVRRRRQSVPDRQHPGTASAQSHDRTDRVQRGKKKNSPSPKNSSSKPYRKSGWIPTRAGQYVVRRTLRSKQ